MMPGVAGGNIVSEIQPALGQTAGVAGLLAAVQHLRNRPDLITSLLQTLAAQPSRLAAVASRSSWHSNGFAKVRLAEAHGYCVRLHVWPASTTRQGDTNAHGHRWGFASWIAVGEGTTETLYEETDADDPVGSVHLRCEHRPSDGTGRLQAKGIAWLRELDNRRHRTGSTYTCDLDVVHTIAPTGDELVATVVVQGRAVADSAKVYLHPHRGPDGPITPITTLDLHELIVEVHGAMTRIGADDTPRSPVRVRTLERLPK